MKVSDSEASHRRMNVARRLRRWAAWEFGRTIEVTPVIRLITLERLLECAVLLAAGVAVLIAGERGLLQELLLRAQTEYDFNGSRGLVARLVRAALERVADVRVSRIQLLAVAGILYGLLKGVEGGGLLLRKRWAEYLVVLATAAFVPVEVRELWLRPSAFKALALLVNLLIVAYLIYRKRLFLERPGAAEPPSR